MMATEETKEFRCVICGAPLSEAQLKALDTEADEIEGMCTHGEFKENALEPTIFAVSEGGICE